MTTVVWTARVVPLDNPAERWNSSDFDLARERPWRIPVLVSHDPAIEIGHLFLIHERADWVEADFILGDTPIGREAAEYMRIGQQVSVGAREMTRPALRWVTEVSVVERGAVPGAQVIGRRELRSSTTGPPPATPRAAAGQVIYGTGETVRRYFPAEFTVR